MELDDHVRGQVVVEGARQWPTARQFGMSREKVKNMWSRAAAGLPAIGASGMTKLEPFLGCRGLRPLCLAWATLDSEALSHLAPVGHPFTGSHTHKEKPMVMRPLFILYTLMVPLGFMHAADSVPLAEKDAQFVKKATIGGLIEIQSAETATKRTTLTTEEQAFAKQLISEHKTANNELATIAKSKGTPLSDGLPADEQKKLMKMAEVKDKNFNEEFLEQQIACHKKAISLFEEEAENGKDADVKAFAVKMLPQLKEHLETAKRLEAKY